MNLTPEQKAYKAAQQANWQAKQAYDQAVLTACKTQASRLLDWLDASDKKNQAFWAYYNSI